MHRRTLSIAAFILLGLISVASSTFGYISATYVSFAVMGTIALIFLAHLLSQVRNEGATQRRNLAALRKLTEDGIRRTQLEIAAELHTESMKIQSRSAKNRDLIKKHLVSDHDAVNTLVEAARTGIEETALKNRKQIQLALDTQLETQIAAVRNTAAWLDALRDVADATDDRVEVLTNEVDRITESVKMVSTSLEQLHRELVEKNDVIAEKISVAELAQTSHVLEQRQQLETIQGLSGQNLVENAFHMERVAKAISSAHSEIGRDLTNALESLSAARDDILDSLKAERMSAESQFASSIKDLRDLVAHSDDTTLDRLSAVSKNLESSLAEKHEKALARVLGSIETAQRNTADSETVSGDGLKEALSSGFDALRSHQARQTNKLNVAMYSETQQIEALLQLLPNVQPRWLMPSLGRWAIDARAMLHLRQIIEDHRPKRILELGSGTSSIWLGYMAEQLGSSVISIEHDEKFRQRTDYFLEKHALSHVVNTLHAPLEPMKLNDLEYHWYSPQAFDGLQDIDLLLIDGPIGTTNRWARYPALPVLWDRLSPNAVVALDDATRHDEAECIESWLADFAVTAIHQGTSGLAVLRRDAQSEDGDAHPQHKIYDRNP